MMKQEQSKLETFRSAFYTLAMVVAVICESVYFGYQFYSDNSSVFIELLEYVSLLFTLVVEVALVYAMVQRIESGFISKAMWIAWIVLNGIVFYSGTIYTLEPDTASDLGYETVFDLAALSGFILQIIIYAQFRFRSIYNTNGNLKKVGEYGLYILIIVIAIGVLEGIVGEPSSSGHGIGNLKLYGWCYVGYIYCLIIYLRAIKRYLNEPQHDGQHQQKEIQESNNLSTN